MDDNLNDVYDTQREIFFFSQKKRKKRTTSLSIRCIYLIPLPVTYSTPHRQTHHSPRQNPFHSIPFHPSHPARQTSSTPLLISSHTSSSINQSIIQIHSRILQKNTHTSLSPGDLHTLSSSPSKLQTPNSKLQTQIQLSILYTYIHTYIRLTNLI